MTTNTLPERNTIFEALIHVGAIGLFTYAFGILLLAFMANPFNGTSSSVVVAMSLLLLAVGAMVALQAVMLIKQQQRVDCYIQRLVAVLLICLLPALIIMRVIADNIVTQLLRGDADPLAASGHWLYIATDAIASGFIVRIAGIASLAAMIWLWTLLLQENKLFWTLTGSPRTKEYKTRQARLTLNNRIGTCLISAPAIVLVAFLLAALAAELSNNDTLAHTVANTLNVVLLLGWIPCLTVGIAVLIRNK